MELNTNKAKSPGYIWNDLVLTKNGAIPREGSCSRSAKRKEQQKAATEKGRTERLEQADGNGPQSKAVGRKR